MSWEGFIEAVANTNIELPGLAVACLAQAIAESGREDSDLAKEHNNHHGMKWRPEMKGIATPVTYATSSEPSGSAEFCKFATKEDAVRGYWSFLERAPYEGFRDHATTPEKFLAFVGPIWCPAGYTAAWKAQHQGLVYHEHIIQRFLAEARELLKPLGPPMPGVELRYGDRGKAVKDLQRELNEHFGAGLEVDGIFGDNTKRAVIALERYAGLEPDGVADVNVWSALASIKPEVESAAGSKTPWIPTAVRLPEIPTKWAYEEGFPRGAVVHFTADVNRPSDTVAYLGTRGFPCLVIGRDGTIYQAFPLNRGGSHSGTYHHNYSVGIEIVSAGRCNKITLNGQERFAPWYAYDKNGKLASPGRCLSASEMRHVEKSGSQREGWYHRYAPEQESSLIELLLWLKAQAPDVFSFEDVKGHDECCDEGNRPGAKNDPGGALSMTMPELRALLRNRYGGYQTRVNDDNPPLNVREGPGTTFAIAHKLDNGTPLTVAENNGSGWLRITSPVSGWVAERLTGEPKHGRPVPYRSNINKVHLPPAVQLGAVWITHHPVEDPEVGLAHLSYSDALALATLHNARLPTSAEILALHQAAAAAGTELAPMNLPDAALRAQGCVPGDARMVTREWCVRHDEAVQRAIAALGDTGNHPIANAGKHWRAGAPPNLAGLCGWWVKELKVWGTGRRGPGFVQAGGGWPHDRQHSDYATTTMLVWDTQP